MKITLEACGKLSDALPTARQMETTAQTVEDFLEELGELMPDIRADLQRTAIARGASILSRSSEIAEGDVLALIPPVGGG